MGFPLAYRSSLSGRLGSRLAGPLALIDFFSRRACCGWACTLPKGKKRGTRKKSGQAWVAYLTRPLSRRTARVLMSSVAPHLHHLFAIRSASWLEPVLFDLLCRFYFFALWFFLLLWLALLQLGCFCVLYFYLFLPGFSCPATLAWIDSSIHLPLSSSRHLEFPSLPFPSYSTATTTPSSVLLLREQTTCLVVLCCSCRLRSTSSCSALLSF